MKITTNNYSIHSGGNDKGYIVSLLALQTFVNPFRKDKKARAFNIVFTILASALVALTDWHCETMMHSARTI